MNTKILKSYLAIALILFLTALSANASSPIYKRAIANKDNPDILSFGLERNLLILGLSTTQQVRLELEPWADKSWHMDSGLLAERNSGWRWGWSSKYKYAVKNSTQKVLKENDFNKRAALIDKLSVAEKYDLLVGDNQGSLTKAQWAQGEIYYRDGTLASWMGICEGSAAASVSYPEPQTYVDLRSPQGDPIRFHILEIKGLASLLWSSYNVKIETAGTRCDTSHPKRNHGVVVDEDCFNANPATLHIALLNYLGLQHRPIFINRMTSNQVWNVPVIGYKIRYFNVAKGSKQEDRLENAISPLSSIRNDNYKNYRSPQATQVVGVNITLNITADTTNSRDSMVKSNVKNLSYQYELELDSNGQIVGGEWNSSSHPDFIWVIDPNLKPLSKGDHLLTGQTWDGGTVPQSWLTAIRQSSINNQPLELIVRKLVEMSQTTTTPVQ